MTKAEDKTIYWNKVSDQSSSDEESGLGNTAQLSRRKLFDEIPMKLPAAHAAQAPALRELRRIGAKPAFA
jgi:hypothetical protein